MDQLVDRGAVSKARSLSDRRAHKIELTPEGRRLLASAVAAAEALDADVRSALSAAGRAALSTLLTELDTYQDLNP